MMPLDIVNNDGTVKNPTQLAQNFQQLKSGGTDGIM